MKRILTAVITAIEAGAVALAGLVVVAIPGILLWIVTFHLESEPAEVLSAISAVWLLGHSVPIGFALDPQAALGFGLAPEALKFTLSLAPLGIGLISAAAGARIGWRLGRRGGYGVVGLPAGVLGFAALTLLPVSLAGPLLAMPVWLAVLTPTLFFGAPAVAGFLVRAAHDDHEWWHRALRELHRGIAALGWQGSAQAVAALRDALRLAAATLSALLALAALSVGVSLIGGYVQVVTLSQHLQLDPIGAIAVFVVQLAFLPVAVIWGLAWLSGSGFSIGAGSSVTPFETLLGPLPALPMFGAIPPAWGAWGPIAILLVVLCAIVCGVAFAGRRGPAGTLREAGIVVAASAFVGLAAAGLSALATGSIGPERLAVTGPNPWLTGGVIAAEVAAGLALGALAARLDFARNLGRRRKFGRPDAASGPGTRDGLLGAPLFAEEHIPALSPERPFTGARALQEHEILVAESADQVTEDYGTLSLVGEGEHDYDYAEPVTSPMRPESPDLDEALAAPGLEDEGDFREVEPEPDEASQVEDEEALVRAYAWDDQAFSAQAPRDEYEGEGTDASAGPDAAAKRTATAGLPWWRQLGVRKAKPGGKGAGSPDIDDPDVTADAGAAATATDLPTVDLGSEPLAKPEQLD